MLAKCDGIGCFIASSLIILAVLLSNGQAFVRRHQENDENFSASQQAGRKLRLDGADYLITSSAGFSRPLSLGHLSKIDALNPAICGKTPAFEGHNQKPSAFECSRPMKMRGRRGRKGSDEFANRFSDGYNATLGEIPSFVHLTFRYSNVPPQELYFSCGGVLISPDLVLTAGHCLKGDFNSAKATAGMLDYNKMEKAQTVNVLGWCRLKEFKILPDGLDSNDIAVLQLAGKFNYTDHIQPACLNYKRRQIKGSVCLGAGFGAISATNNSQTLIAMPMRDGCDLMNSDEHARTCYSAATDLGFKGQSCHGDSGSGLYCVDRCAGKGAQLYVMGLVSFATWRCIKSVPPQPVIMADFNKMADRLEPLLDRCYESGR